ncbi:MAG: hypothetical protein LAO77_21100 [Acidobacteriia bacterium]|nr:hypothetical protein [Terriglobia bacterium]
MTGKRERFSAPAVEIYLAKGQGMQARRRLLRQGWLTLAALIVIGRPVAAFAQTPNALFTDEGGRRIAASSVMRGSIVRRSRTTAVHLEMLTAPGPAPSGWASRAPSPARSVNLNLFTDVNLVAQFDRLERVAATNGTAWVGTVSGVEASQVILSVAGGVLSAAISVPGHFYSATWQSDGSYTIADLAPDAMLPGVEPLVSGAPVDAVPAVGATGADSGDTLDLLLYYTTAAKNAMGGLAAVNSRVTATIALINSAYLSSGIPTRFRLVGAIEMAYAESDSAGNALSALAQNPAVQKDRDRLGADLVTIIVSHDPTISGIAYLLTNVDPSSQSQAFSAIAYQTGTNTFPQPYFGPLPHELGHNMGCLHDPANNGGNLGPLFYAQGFTDFTNKFKDIMSYGTGLDCSSGCNYLLQYSSPNNTYQGHPTGTATQDCARAISTTRTTVANYRQSLRPSLGAPTDLTVSSSGSSVSLSWGAGTGAITGYVIAVGSVTGASDVALFNTGSSATTLSADGIANGLYYIRVMATDGVTTSGESNESVLQVGPCSAAPVAPTNVVNIALGSTVILRWTSGARATGYVLEAGSASGLANLAVSDITNSMTSFQGFISPFAPIGNSNQVGLVAPGIGAGTYYVRLRSKNGCGLSGPSNETVVVVK